MSEQDPGDVTEQDSDLMEGLLFDLGIYGVDHPMSSLGVSRPAPGLSPAPACGPLPSVTTGLCFGDDPLRELTEKCAADMPPGELLIFRLFLITLSIGVVVSAGGGGVSLIKDNILPQ